MVKSTEFIKICHRKLVATVTINRPEALNSINYDMWLELTNILDLLDQDLQTRCIIITGAGEKAFCAGADIAEFKDFRSDSEKGKSYNNRVDCLLNTIRHLNTPIIAMVNGIAAGGGCEISVAADLRIGSTNSKLGIPVAKLGITIGHAEMKSLVELVGRGTAMYILLTGRLLNADEALKSGLLNHVVDQSDLVSFTNAIAEEISDLAPLSHAGNKQTMNHISEISSLNELNEQQKMLPLAQFDTADYQEGFNAFLEKRKPSFEGK